MDPFKQAVRKSERIPGIDTIQGLAGSPPKINVISYKVMEAEHLLQQAWNAINIAIIPYCYKCKSPLDWHSPPDGYKVFTCPTCNRQWVLGEKNGKTKKNTN
ncbi:hypothetical protein LCGC14_2822490 [marine sediment metagenome]|uniref:Uncharacterized protein n=1 Tax=marine sediment metagenome TaxID=412755 RepID=A0A0F9AQ15_9ZZZZ